jgi:hypothetical protein
VVQTVLEETHVTRFGAKRAPAALVGVRTARTLRGRDTDLSGTIAGTDASDTTHYENNIYAYLEVSLWNHITYSEF